MERHLGSREQRNTTQSYHTTNVTQEIYWEKTRRVAASVRVRNSSKLNRIQNFYIEFLGKGVELFRVELSRVEIVGISCPEIGLFTLWDGAESISKIEASLQFQRVGQSGHFSS